MTDTGHTFNVLTPAGIHALRVERVRLIEEDLCRAFLQLEEVQSDGEKQAVINDISMLRERLSPHYRALGFEPPVQPESKDRINESGA